MTYPTPDEFWNADGRGKLRMLSAALRNMPKTHEWDFSEVLKRRACGTAGCALGLGKFLWGDFSSRDTRGDAHIYDTLQGAADNCGENGSALFFCSTLYGQPYHDDITPLMVADKIDELLGEGETK